MTQFPLAISLTIALAAGSAFAAEGDMYDMSPAAQGTTPAYAAAHDQAPRTTSPEQLELRANHGDTGRGQGSGVMMSNRGEMAAEQRDAARQDKPLQQERGETGSGQGSGPMNGQQDVRRAETPMQSSPMR